jgi:uncharacterized protein
MVRLLVLIVLVVLAVWLVRRALRGPNQPTIKEGDLVACAHCGVHLPRSEARQSEGALYCSEEHARLGKR